MNKEQTKIVARINKVDIVVIENGERLVAVKPICQALGVASNGQIEKIKNDPILSSVNKIILSTGSDEKQYEMFVIPFKYVFGWLFQIDSRKVKEESRESVLRYQIECYDVLYNHFTLPGRFMEHKQKLIDSSINKVKAIKKEFNTAKGKLKEAENELDATRVYSQEDYQIEIAQREIFSEDEMNGNIPS